MPPIRRLAAIMFSDIVGYTAMMQQDEADAVARVKRYRQVLSDRVEAHHGEILQHYGDGSLSIFSSAVEAVTCAKEIQLTLHQAPQVPLRIGIHIGDVVREGDDLYGDGINIASRVQGLAPPGGVLFTERVKEDIRSHPEFRSTALGKYALKNVDQPMPIYGLAGEGFPSLRRNEISGEKITPLRKWVLSGIGILALLTLIYFALMPFIFKKQTTINTSNEGPSIAVLPFKDMSPNHDQSFFGDGIAEEILNALAQVKGLKVAGRTSSFSFRDATLDMKEIGHRLGVSTVLEGSIRKAGNRFRITAQLINTTDGFHLWSETYDREQSDIFAIQEEIAQTVVNKLAGILVKSDTPTLIKPATRNQAAYESYLRGKYMLSLRADGAAQAVDFFEEAIALDSQFAPAYAGLGNAYLWLGWSNAAPSDETFPKAREYARQALRYDSTLAYAHAILGAVYLWYDWDWAAARTALEKTIVLNPSESRAYLDLGWYYAVSGRLDEAIAQMEKAVSLDPFNLEYNIDLADISRMAGRFDKATGIARAMQERYPKNSETYWMLGLIDFSRQEYAKAIPQMEESVKRSNGEAWSKLYLAMCQAKAGEMQKAKTTLQEVLKDKSIPETAPVELAMAYLCLQQTQKSLDLLEHSYQIHANWLISIEMDPFWEALAKEPRFKLLVEKMGFPE